MVTPPLDGTILPGVTRDSVLQLLRQWGGCQVSERPISVREVQEVSVCHTLAAAYNIASVCGKCRR